MHDWQEAAAAFGPWSSIKSKEKISVYKLAVNEIWYY